MFAFKHVIKFICILFCFCVATISVLFPQTTYAQRFDHQNQANTREISNQYTEKTEQYQSPTIAELKSRLLQVDYEIALRALNDALNEIPDNVTYKWTREGSWLQGRVTPTSVFRDSDGRLCRHVVYALALGGYSNQIESIACRDLNGNWILSG